MPMSNRRCLPAVLLAAVISSASVAEEQLLPEQQSDVQEPVTDPQIPAEPDVSGETLDELEVEGTASDDYFAIDPLRPSTRIGREDIERSQATDVFEVIRDVPGVSISGSSLSHGKSITIRGFQDSEDVLIKLDGVIKDFEKYRFGSGPFIDPELLKSVAVERGSSNLFTGSGAIGGAVTMETRDARDLLRPEQRIGARVRASHENNNDATGYSATVYAAPIRQIDMLISRSNRRTNDITLADGSGLPNSDAPEDSLLAKAEVHPLQDLTLGYTQSRYESESLKPFDEAAGSTGGGNSYVRRLVRDETRVANLNFNPVSHWIDLRASTGYAHTLVDDLGWDDSSSPYDSLLNENQGNRFLFDLWTAEINNRSYHQLGPLQTELRYGLQWHRNSRDTRRLLDDMDIGPNETQPPGEKEYVAYILEAELQLGDVRFRPTFRRDHYTIRAGETVDELLLAEGRSTRIDFQEETWHAQVSWAPLGGPVNLFFSTSRSFRPPLIDEYYNRLGFICNPFVLSLGTPWGIPTGLGFSSGLCAELYEPEEIRSHEAGISFEDHGLFDPLDMLTLRLSHYRSRIDNLIETMTLVSANELGQPGFERRRGWELEAHYDRPGGYARISYSRTRGELECPGWSPVTDNILLLPADRLNLTLARRLFGDRLEIGYRANRVWSRKSLQSGAAGNLNPCKNTYPTEVQKSYTLHNVFLSWRPVDAATLRISWENLGNKEYTLENLASSGLEGPGRSLRMSVSYQF